MNLRSIQGLSFSLLLAWAANVIAQPASESGMPTNISGGVDVLTALSNAPRAVRGVVKPLAEASLSTDLPARIKTMPFRAGMTFKKGDLLIGFDCTRHRAQLAASDAARRSAVSVHRNNQELASYDALGEHEVRMSQAEMQRATAEFKVQKAVVAQCEIHAPFSGRVVKSHVNAYESTGQGAPLVDIIDDSDFEVEIIVPSAWLVWLSIDSTFEFAIDETGQRYDAIVSQVGAAVDPVSQTVLITGRFGSRPDQVLAGMSGSAHFQSQPIAVAD